MEERIVLRGKGRRPNQQAAFAKELEKYILMGYTFDFPMKSLADRSVLVGVRTPKAVLYLKSSLEGVEIGAPVTDKEPEPDKVEDELEALIKEAKDLGIAIGNTKDPEKIKAKIEKHKNK